MTIAALAPALAQAARLVAGVAAGKSLTQGLRSLPAEDAPRRAALVDLTHGTLRRYGRVQRIVRELSHRASADAELQALLWCALYALESGRYAPYTVVDHSVRACGILEKWSAKGYVNAVLRGVLREGATLDARIAGDLEARYQHPAWWIEILRQAYPAHWTEVLAAGNTHPPMCLRINRRRTTLAGYEERLAAAGIAARRVAEAGLLVERPVPVERLPGFASGDVSVQDAGAQRASVCLDLQTGQRVLDACAAPGGKAAHILESADVALTAVDNDAARTTRMTANFARLGLQASVVAGDSARPHDWWGGEPFERILADVPCSASGIARRQPDVKWLRRGADLAAFAARQGVLLDALWQLLCADGKLLYATCSVFPQENDAVIEAFVARTSGARRLPLPDAGEAQWLPDAEHDGFYYALIHKQA